MITRINPPELGTPPGYSQIVEVKVGRIIFTKSYVQGTEEDVLPELSSSHDDQVPFTSMSIRLS